MLGSQILDVFPILKDLFNFIRQSLQLCEIGCIFFGGKAPQQIRHVNGQQVYDSQLCTVRLCRRYRDFRASPCIDHIVGLVCDGAPHHVDDRKSSRAQALCLTHSSQCIGGFPGLADHQHQHLFVDDRLPVAEFGCDIHFHGNPGHLLQYIFRHHSHMVGGTTGHNKDLSKRLELVRCQRDVVQNNPPILDARRNGIAHRFGLFHDLLCHKVLIAALFSGGDIPLHMDWFFGDQLLIHVIDAHPFALDDRNLVVIQAVNVARSAQDCRDV